MYVCMCICMRSVYVKRDLDVCTECHTLHRRREQTRRRRWDLEMYAQNICIYQKRPIYIYTCIYDIYIYIRIWYMYICMRPVYINGDLDVCGECHTCIAAASRLTDSAETHTLCTLCMYISACGSNARVTLCACIYCACIYTHDLNIHIWDICRYTKRPIYMHCCCKQMCWRRWDLEMCTMYIEKYV